MQNTHLLKLKSPPFPSDPTTNASNTARATALKQRPGPSCAGSQTQTRNPCRENIYHQYIISSVYTVCSNSERKKWRISAPLVAQPTTLNSSLTQSVTQRPLRTYLAMVAKPAPQFKKILKDWFEHSKMPARKSWKCPFLAAEANCWISFFV